MKILKKLTNTVNFKKTNFWTLGALLLTAFCFLISTNLSAQMIDYYINVKTADIYTAGTDNHIQIKIHGATEDTGYFRVKGSSERDELEGFTVYKKDVGKIYAITVDVIGDLADKWNVEYITVTRNSKEREIRNSEDGYYEFSINRQLDYDPVYFTPTTSRDPRVSLDSEGNPVVNKTYYTEVNFGNNPHHTTAQEVMKFTEHWESLEGVTISTTETTTVGASLTLSYESPETVYGKFGAEATGSWQDMVQESEVKTNQYKNGSKFDWNYTAPPNTAVFRKVIFEIPYSDQVYSDGTNYRVVRKLNDQIKPVGGDFFLFIPTLENNGEKVVPVAWSEIENNWLIYLDEKVKETILRELKDDWLANGWVYETKNDATNSTFKPTTNTLYTIRSKAAGHQNLDVHGAKTIHGTNITLYGSSEKGFFNQHFHFVPTGDGYYFIESSLKPNMVIDIADWGTADGTNAQLVKRTIGTSAQKFKLLDVGNGYVQIVSAMGDNLYLGVNDAKNNVVLRNSNKGDKVLFKLHSVKKYK